ncbi:MAG: LbtU family siderophore porin [Thermodesulfobacteriota bacterium]|nr:LbtU family siderophore porin [Thermodesulfobacteriota bacterium]
MKRLFVVTLSLIIAVFVVSGPAVCDEDGERWFENVTLSGAIEVEAGFEKIDYNDPATKDEDSSDIVIATVEAGIDAEIVKHVSGHLLFLYEEDDTDLEVDEAIISIKGEDVVPLYLNAGQMYVPFGNFESHMISEPITLELGETRESAVVAGFATDWLDISAGVFNGDIDEIGEDNKIESYVAGAVFTLPENTVSGFVLSAGGSYISNIGDSDSLQEDIESGPVTIRDYVAGYSAFISISALDRFFLNAEYLTAADEFAAGELSFDGGRKFKPSTWYAELAVSVIDDLEVAVRYEASDDGGDFLPEKRYGGAITYGLFENTSLGLEYLHGEFKNDDEIDVVTAQLAIEF